MKPRLLITLAFAGFVGLVFLVASYRVQESATIANFPVIKPAVVRCQTLEERTYKVTESFWGLIEANASVDMAFQISGRISQLGAKSDNPIVENQKVRRGQVIATLEPLRYKAAIQQAEASIKQVKAAMASAQALVNQAKARQTDAEQELARVKRLRLHNAATEREVEKAELELTLSKASVDGAYAQRASADASYSASRAALTMAQVNLQDATLRAPMDATVAEIPVEIGKMIAPGESVVTLVDKRSVKLVLGVVERKLPLLRRGQSVSVELLALSSQSKLLSDSNALQKPRSGIVTMIPPASDTSSGLFNVEIELPNDDGLLSPGMVGKATVTVFEKKGVAVPATAAVRTGDRASAYFVTTGYHVGLDLGPIGDTVLEVPAPIAQRISFEPVVFDKDYYLLVDAPKGLDQLIVEGQSRLGDGQTVRVISPLTGAHARAGG